MEEIKMFEYHKKYWKLNDLDFFKFKSLSPFYDSDIQKIRRYFPDINIILNNNKITLKFEDSIIYIIKYSSIFKLVNFNMDIYVCDGIDGLIECLKNLLDDYLLQEKKLTILDLEKGESGNNRGKKLIDKVISGEPLLFCDGSLKKISNIDDFRAILNNDGTYNHQKSINFFKNTTNNRRYSKSICSDGIFYSLTDIEKTPEFGGGRGSSLGTISTRLEESIQCFFIKLRELKGAGVREDLDENSYLEVIKKIDQLNKFIYIDKNIIINQEIIEEFVKRWNYTFYKSANYLFGLYPDVYHTKNRRKKIDYSLKFNKNYKIYQIGSKTYFMESIMNSYRNLVNDKTINFAKWNPSDIWLVSSEKESIILGNINSCKNIIELNTIIDRYFDTRDLVSVSLKKLSYSSNIIINKETERPTYKFLEIKTNENPFKTIGVTVFNNRQSEHFGNDIEKITFRTFGDKTNISGEIIGDSSRHGKISLSQINNIILKHLEDSTYKIPTWYEINNQYKKEELKLKIIEIFNLLTSNSKFKTDKKFSLDSDIPSNLNINRMISKYQSLLLSKVLLDIDSYIADEIIQDIIYYALSISNSNFICPKYVRFI